MFGGVFQEIWGEGDFSWLEDRDGGGAAEGEIAFFRAFGHGLAGGEGLVDGADAGGADFHDEDGAVVFCFEAGEGAFVGPEVGEVLREGDGGDGKQGAGEGFCFRRGACSGEVVAVVIDRAEAGEDEGAFGVFFGEFGIAEEGW